MMVLKTLSLGPLHGFAIAESIQQVTDDCLTVEEGSLYPALHRMEKRGWIEGAWGNLPAGNRVRVYKLTRMGRAQLRKEIDRWVRFGEAASKVLAQERLAEA